MSISFSLESCVFFHSFQLKLFFLSLNGTLHGFLFINLFFLRRKQTKNECSFLLPYQHNSTKNAHRKNYCSHLTVHCLNSITSLMRSFIFKFVIYDSEQLNTPFSAMNLCCMRVDETCFYIVAK